MAAPWEKYASAPQQAPWEKYSEPSPDIAEEPGRLTALGRGATQGLSLGFADEIAGGVGSAKNAISNMSLSDVVKDYIRKRDEYRQDDEAAKKAHPNYFTGGEVGGGLATAFIPGANIGKIGTVAGRVAASGVLGAATGLGTSNADLTKGEYGQAAKDTALGGVIGTAIPVALEKGVVPLVSKGGQMLGNKLGSAAENFAVKATGATGREAENFAPGTGRALLDEGVVKFGSGPQGVATRANQVLERSGDAIDTALNEVPDTISKTQVMADLKQRASALRQDPSQAPVARRIEKIIENIADPAVPEDLTALQAEQIKRGFQGQSNYFKPNTTQATKETASVFKNAVEQKASDFDPAVAGLFEGAKKDYGMFKPVADAAERRSSQLEQSPIGGFMDMATAGVGSMATGIPHAGPVAAVGRRLLAPKMASATAVGLDTASKIASGAINTEQIVEKLSAYPKAQKFANAIRAAASRGQQALAATHFILGQTQPAYQRAVQGE